MNRSKKVRWDEDLMFIEEGLQPGAGQEERIKADTVLKSRGYEHKSKAKKKPGPKKKSSINPTEEKLARIITEMRSLLKRPRASKAEVLGLLAAAFSRFEAICNTGLFVSAAHTQKIHSFVLDCREDVAALVKELEPEFHRLSDELRKAKKLTLQDLLESSEPLQVTHEPREHIYYRRLKSMLRLKCDESAADVDETRGVPRPVILEAALERLLEITAILEDSSFLSAVLLESLYFKLREICFYPQGSLAMRPLFDLESIFLESIKRQGTSPFPPFALEATDV